ncbi:MAG: hypothetical protein SPI83_03335 [Rothia sp. (in: high G+C Gram-positive bacteria)]|nr:hypothetical protein [Rothia sp. (in: high G+C Gram-positive bacteria)]
MSESEIPITLTSTSKAESLAHETLLLVAQAYAGRTDYRIIGGQMVMLLQKIYPLPEQTEPRFTLDTDAALGNTETPLKENTSVLELLEKADQQLIRVGFTKAGGSAYIRGQHGTDSYQEVNFLQPFNANPKAGKIQAARIPLADEDSLRQLDSLFELEHVLTVPPVRLKVYFSDFETTATLCIPPVEQAVILKTFATAGRGYLDRDLKDLRSLLLIREHFMSIPWGLHRKNLIGLRKDTAHQLHTISARLRRKNVDGFNRNDRNELRQLIGQNVTNPAA